MITLLKCESCGGSDFKKHPDINEFLVCNNCGNQYMRQIRKIKENLPLDLKETIKSDMSKLKVNNCIIIGDMNNIIGDDNVIKGDMNKINGKRNITKGDMNTII